MKIKQILIIVLILCSCSGNDETIKENEQFTRDDIEQDQFQIIAERIDGPANVRIKPNGEILFSLDDNTLVDISPSKDGWHELIFYANLNKEQYEEDSILVDTPIMVGSERVGKFLKTIENYPSSHGGKYWTQLHGFTHESNIKKETVIETILLKRLKERDRSFEYWSEFIYQFDLRDNAVDYPQFESYYNYENSVEDPSPGFRIVLLFENKQLVGFIHSRSLNLIGMTTFSLNWSYQISYFEDYPEAKQTKFVHFMNNWIQGVD